MLSQTGPDSPTLGPAAVTCLSPVTLPCMQMPQFVWLSSRRQVFGFSPVILFLFTAHVTANIPGDFLVYRMTEAVEEEEARKPVWRECEGMPADSAPGPAIPLRRKRPEEPKAGPQRGACPPAFKAALARAQG